jgi:hypothetical protein
MLAILGFLYVGSAIIWFIINYTDWRYAKEYTGDYEETVTYARRVAMTPIWIVPASKLLFVEIQELVHDMQLDSKGKP